MNDTVEKKAAVKNGVIRLCFAGIALLLEVFVMVLLITKYNAFAQQISIGLRLLAGILVLGIYSENKTSTMKTPWIILILVFPVFGTLLYLMIGLNGSTKWMRKQFEASDHELLPKLSQEEQTLEKLENITPGVANLSKYLMKYSGYPVYANTQVTYFADAADALMAQKEELKKARDFIFMEYHAIEDAQAWHGIQKILEERAGAGVEVRLFYDDMGSIGFITTDFVKRMEAKGIHCHAFNPISPFLNLFLNNRDHRKITVIDGQVGFTGGYNLANEYFNLVHPYGHWKDTGIQVTGEAVRSLTVTFLEMWTAVSRQKETVPERYFPDAERPAGAEGFVQPYADSPLDEEQVGENVYISLAESARKYVWFITPYLIITDEMIHALGLAAKRGVDVRVITPGIPDKKMVYGVTRSYYHSLTRNGVKIYEYTPGFCHCKMCVSDDEVATCGTINLDYRSLYHHFENGCVYSSCSAVQDTKADFDAILSQCRDVTKQYITGRNTGLRFGQLVLRLFAPLM